MNDALPPALGSVTFTERRGGRVVRRWTAHNAYTSLAAADHARLVSGEPSPPSLVPVSVALGVGGATLSECEAATGWSDSPVVDAVVFRQAYASLSRTVSASGTANPRNSALVSATAAPGSVVASLMLDRRGYCDLSASSLRVYCGGDTVYFNATLAAVEAACGLFVDAAWADVSVPQSAFTVGAGSPSWSAVTGFGLVVAANAGGPLTARWDDVRLAGAIDTSAAAVAVPNTRKSAAVTDLSRSGSTVTATAVWGTLDAVGWWSVAGLWSNGGTTLMAIVPVNWYKAAGSTLTVNWAVTPQGG